MLCDTQPIYKLSKSLGSYPLPMMNSLEPPPTSMTRRLPETAGASCEVPIYIRRASSTPAMTSIGNPSAICAYCTNFWAFLATRKVLVATARTCSGLNPRKRSPKRRIAFKPRSMASSSKTLPGLKPAARRTGSRRVSMVLSCIPEGVM